MLLKRSATTLCPGIVAPSVFCPGLASSATSSCRPRRVCPTKAVPLRNAQPQCRSHASVHDSKPDQMRDGKGRDHLGWPMSAKPTPYEILGLARDAPYNKARYFQLAKLYHPDLHHNSPDDGLSHLTKLERYRLVVAANDIISNPQKRRMYDLYGLGWDDHSHHGAVDRAWRHQPGNASMNATWEDWERWYQERDGTGGKQELNFASNGVFMGIVGLFLIIGAWSQVTRAGTHSLTLLEMRDQEHMAISRELRRRHAATAEMSREGRIQNFLRQREFERWAHDPPGHGLPDGCDVSSKHAR
ncbi:hypothetical protein VTK26DRAFT_408 [Humicola hyalothermophila]